MDVSEENKISKIKGKFFFLNFLRDSEFDHKTIENIHFLLNNFFRFPYKIQSWLLSRNGPKFEKKIVKLKEKQAKCREFAIFWSILTGLSSKVEKTRQIERKSRNCPSRFKSRKKLVKLARIVEFWVSFYCSKFKSRKNSPNWKEVEKLPL